MALACLFITIEFVILNIYRMQAEAISDPSMLPVGRLGINELLSRCQIQVEWEPNSPSAWYSLSNVYGVEVGH
jgi:hypothetical protein